MIQRKIFLAFVRAVFAVLLTSTPAGANDYQAAFQLLFNSDPTPLPQGVIKATADGKVWHFDYGLGDGVPKGALPAECAFDGPLIVQQGRRIQLWVTSVQFVSAFRVASLGIHTDAIPGRLNSVDVDTSWVGDFDGEAAIGRPSEATAVPVKVRVLDRQSYAAWLKERLMKKDCLPKQGG